MHQRLNNTYGSTLPRVYFCVLDNGEVDLNAYTHTDAYIVSLNTFMDGLILQGFTLTPADRTASLYNEYNFTNAWLQSLDNITQHLHTHVDN